MSDHTAHGPRAGTKTTKLTTITNNYWVFVIFVAFVIFVPAPGPSAVSVSAAQDQQTPTQAQQRPVFRGGTHFVRVDAYPVQDGKIVEGLKAEDFDILEDGKPQAIESFDFVRFDTFTPLDQRLDPHTQREGFEMAMDPRNRVFAIFVDMVAAGRIDIHRIQEPLVAFMNRVLGPRDLFGFVTSRNRADDLVLSGVSTAIEAQVRDLFRSANIDRDEADDLLFGCPFSDRVVKALQALYRLDQSYTTLNGLVRNLGALREERKSIILISSGLSRDRPATWLLEQVVLKMPRIGITNGKLGIGDENTANPGGTSERVCTAELQRLAAIDFDERYRRLLQDARRENVAFYPVSPAGLSAPAGPTEQRLVNLRNDDLKSLADETDGVAIVGTNDLNAGMKRIADDLAAYYVLGYYTSNTKWDGGIRKISVKLKGKSIRARRQYRAPTEGEIAALASVGSAQSAAPASSATTVTPREAALTILERANRPFVPYVAAAGTTLTVVAELSAASIQAGRWKDGADVDVQAVGANGEPLGGAKGRIEAGAYSVAIPLTVKGTWPARVTIALRSAGERPSEDWVKLEPSSGTLVGEAVASRAASRTTPRPVAAFEFARNERLRVEWPVLAPLDRREVRLLDRNAKPLPVELPLSEDSAKKALTMEMALSGLPRGDYLIELTAGSGATIEHRLLAIRIKP
jgi:VWFA-related protein